MRLRLGLAAAAAALVLGAATSASGDMLAPDAGQIFFGATDTGQLTDFQSFADSVGKHPAVIETFHPWGNSLHYAIPRWGEAQARPMLHISTVDPNTLAEIITPQGIATGTSDDYLIRLNSSFATRHILAYIRPLGEMNRCLNPWSSYTCDGASRGDSYTPYWYKQAFRRIAIVIRGGGSLAEINAKLAATNLPSLDRKAGNGLEPSSLPAAPVSMVWSPLPGGLAGDEEEPARQLLSGLCIRRLDRHRHLLALSGLEDPDPLLQGQEVPPQAVCAHRVGRIGGR